MASGDTIKEFDPKGGFYESGAYKSRTQSRNVGVLPASSTDPAVTFIGFMPRQYSGGGITVVVAWYCDIGSGNVCFKAAFERLNDGVLLSTSTFASSQAATRSVPVATRKVSYTEIAFSGSQIDGIQVGEIFQVKLARENTIVGNTSGDAFVLGVLLKES